jgi:DNA-binding IclR family transcriptional regulator
MAAQPTDLIQSVSRALRVLEQVTRAGRPVPVKVIARRCGLNLSTTYHLVRTLSYEGYLIRYPDGYTVGPEVAERFHELAGSFQRPPSASTVLRHLADACQHTAYLARVVADRMVVVEVVEGPGSPWLEDLQVGLDAAAHATALGKSLLTTLPLGAASRVLAAQGMRPFTRRTATDLETIEGELRGLRPGDVVVERGEFRDEVACASIATPAKDAGGWWALGVSTRGLDLPGPMLAELKLAAADLSGSPSPALRRRRPPRHQVLPR